jgi:hypothetical protein
MSAHPQLLLDALQLGYQTFASRPPPEGKVALPVFPAIMREPQEVERLRLPFSPPLSVSLGVSAELEQSRLVCIQFQSEFRQAFPKLFLESLSVLPVLEPHD